MTVALLALLLVQDEQAVLQALDRFIVPFREGKVDEAMKAFSDKSPQRDAVKAQVEQALAYKVAREEFELQSMEKDAEGLVATLRFKGRWLPEDEEYTDETHAVWTIVLKQEGADWKWFWLVPTAAVLATELSEAPGAAERKPLLEAKRAQVGQRLIATLQEQAIAAAFSNKRPEGYRLSAIGDEAAAFSGNEQVIALQRLYRGQLRLAFEKPGDGIADFSAARDGLLKAGRDEHATWARNHLAFAYADSGRSDLALQELEPALAWAKKATNRPLMFELEVCRGIAHQKRREFQEAGRWYGRAIATAYLMKAEPEFHARAWYHSAFSRFEAGEPGPALDETMRGLSWLEQKDDPLMRAKLLNNQGLVQLTLGNHEAALASFRASLELWIALESPRLIGPLRMNIAEVERILGRHEDAAADFRAAIDILVKAEDLPMALMARNGLGVALTAARRPAEALKEYRLVLQAPESPELIPVLAAAHSNIADAQMRLGRLADAMPSLREVLRLAKSGGSDSLLYLAHVGLGMGHALTDTPESLKAAVGHLQEAVVVTERARSGLQDPVLRYSFLAENVHVYGLLVDVLLRLDLKAEAFAVSERAKARSIVELQEAGGGALAKSLEPEEREEEARLRDAVSSRTARVEAARTADARDALEKELAKAREALEAFRFRCYVNHPELAEASGRFAPAGLEELGRALGADGVPTLLLSYALLPDGLALFVVSEGKLTVRRRTLEAGDLAAAVEAFWAKCAVAGSDGAVEAAALGALLLEPVADLLKEPKRLLICADGVLHGVPFAALRQPGGGLVVEKHSVAYAPSATALLKMRALLKRPAGKGTLIVGDPTMPAGYGALAHARREAEGMRGKPGWTVLTGAEATEPAVVAAMSDARRIHLATHGVVDEARPLASFVVLAAKDNADGFLQASEIADLSLKADLAILSACNTARGRQVRGEGVVGLSWSLFAAGVPATAVSLWAVSDDSTGELMRAFHEALDDPAVPGMAEALAVAQRKLLKTRPDPYAWAPFLLIGEPGKRR